MQLTVPAQGIPSLVRHLPGVVLVGAGVVLLAATDVPVGHALLYAAYFGFAIVVPGMLLSRALLGSGGSLLADLAWGSVVGLVVEIFAWAATTSIGVNELLVVVPASILAIFSLVPSLRTYWRVAPGTAPTPPLLAWSVVGATVLGWIYLATTFFRLNTPGVSNLPGFVDLPWHLGVAHEATRHLILTTPEASAEGHLHYHFFVDAHFAAAGLTSQVPLATILTRAGLVSLVFVMVASSACLAVRIAQRPAVGALVALAVVATAPGLDYWLRTHKSPVLFPESPSGMYSVGFSCLLVGLLVDLLRDGRLRRTTWLFLPALLFVCVGAKPSILLVVLPGAAIFGLVDLVRRKKVRMPLILFGVLMAGAVLVSIPIFASSGGSRFDPSLIQVLVWNGTVYHTPIPVLVATAVMKGYLLGPLGVGLLLATRLRREPVAWLLAAITAVGIAEAWLISHPGQSQRFFWVSAVPFAAILVAWGLMVLIDGAREIAVRRLVVVCGGVALVSLLVLQGWLGDEPSVRWGWLGLAVGLVAAVVASRALRLSPVAGMAALVVGAIVMSTVVSVVLTPWKDSPDVGKARYLDQRRAAEWIEQHVPEGAVLATNSHCLGPTIEHCDARSFWLSGYGGRQVLLGGYGVSPAALRRHDVDGISAWRQPYHDQDLYRLNERTFTRPTPWRIRILHDRYHVDYLVADSTAGAVSPKLDALVEPVHRNGNVSVYRIVRSRLAAR